jgi:hypothetical protein
VDGIESALRDLHARWQAGALEDSPLSVDWQHRVARRTRVEELSHLLDRVSA